MRISDWSSDVCSSDLVGYETYLLPASAYGAAPSGTILYASGGNPSLRPERARSWSAGVTFEPTPALRLWASYFNVRYRDRVAQPVPGSIASAFSDPGYATLIDRAPSADLLTDLIERSEAHTSELQSLMRSSYSVFCLKKT